VGSWNDDDASEPIRPRVAARAGAMIRAASQKYFEETGRWPQRRMNQPPREAALGFTTIASTIFQQPLG